MKKRLVIGALGIALAGAAALPVGSAFGKTKKPPSAAAVAAHCAVLEGLDKSYDTEIAGTTDPTSLAILNALEDSNDARITALGCTFTD